MKRAFWELQNLRYLPALGTAVLAVALQQAVPTECVWSSLCPTVSPEAAEALRWVVGTVISVFLTIIVLTLRAGIHQRDDLREKLKNLKKTEPRELWIDFNMTGRVAYEPDGLLSVLKLRNMGETATFKVTATWDRLDSYVPWVIPWSDGECSRTIIHDDEADLLLGGLMQQADGLWRVDPFRCKNTTGHRKELGTTAHVMLDCFVDMTTEDGHGRKFFKVDFLTDGTPLVD